MILAANSSASSTSFCNAVRSGGHEHRAINASICSIVTGHCSSTYRLKTSPKVMGRSVGM